MPGQWYGIIHGFPASRHRSPVSRSLLRYDNGEMFQCDAQPPDRCVSGRVPYGTYCLTIKNDPVCCDTLFRRCITVIPDRPAIGSPDMQAVISPGSLMAGRSFRFLRFMTWKPDRCLWKNWYLNNFFVGTYGSLFLTICSHLNPIQERRWR